MGRRIHGLLLIALLSPTWAEALSVSVVTPTSVSMAWEASPDAPVTYIVQQSKVPGGPYADAVSTAGLSETVSGLTPGDTYYWIVRSVNARGFWSTPSNEVSIRMPTGPSGSDCAPVTGTFAVSVFPTSLLFTGSKGPGSKTRFDFQVASPNSPVTTITVTAGAATIASMGGPDSDLTNLAGIWFVMPASGTYELSVQATNRQGCTKLASYSRALVVP